MPASTYLANKWLDMLGATAFAAPATVYLQLDRTQWLVDGTGGLSQPGATAARVAVTWAAASSRQKASSALISFSSDAPADWAGTLVAFSVWDALGNTGAPITGGNLLWTDLLTANLVVAQHSVVQVAAGQAALIFS